MEPLINGFSPLTFSHHITAEIIQDIEGSIIIVMHIPAMLEFLEDIDQYICDLAQACLPSSFEYNIAQSSCSVSASSSALSPAEEVCSLF
jgi:hypothetical protein